MQYRAEIDGLRAIAVVPVILFHAGFEIFSGGFVGVDIFFVISGYLITSILLLEIRQEKFSLLNFYERRARRILPALFFVVIVCIPFAWMWLLPSDMKDFSQSIVAVAVFSSNFLFWGESGYFDTSTEVKPLLHTWSLAVEEQFYLIFPLLLIITRKLVTYKLIIILSIIVISSFILAEWGSRYVPEAAFYLLPFRAFELLLGALSAFYLLSKNKPKGSQFLSLSGLMLIIVSIFYFDKQTLFPGVNALIPTIGAVLIILFATPTTIVCKILSSKLSVSIGLISYSAYLWHQPLFAFARYNTNISVTYYSMAILTILTFILAYFTWRVIEAPFRNRNKTSRTLIFSSMVVVSTMGIAFGALGHNTGGFSNRYPPEILNISSEMPKMKIAGVECFGRANNFCGEDKINSGKTDVFVIGDSSIEPIAKQLDSRTQNLNVIDVNSAGCVLIKGFELQRNKVTDISCSADKFDYLLNLVRKSENPVVIWGGMLPKVLSGKWYQRLGELSHPDQVTGDDEWHKKYHSKNSNRVLEDSIVETLEILSVESDLLIVLYPNVEFGVNVSKTLKMKYLHRGFKTENFPIVSLPTSEYFNRAKTTFELLDSVSAESIRRIYPHKKLCSDSDDLCYANIENNVFFVDHIHPSDSGAAQIVDLILEELN